MERLPCLHSGTYADDCICERVRQHRCYIVATCDRDLRQRLRKVTSRIASASAIIQVVALLHWECWLAAQRSPSCVQANLTVETRSCIAFFLLCLYGACLKLCSLSYVQAWSRSAVGSSRFT